VLDDLSLLPAAPVTVPVVAGRTGWLAGVDTEGVGRLAASLGAGRRRKTDRIDPAVAVELTAKLGERIEAGAPVGAIMAADQAGAERAAAGLLELLDIGPEPVQPPPLVRREVHP